MTRTNHIYCGCEGLPHGKLGVKKGCNGQVVETVGEREGKEDRGGGPLDFSLALSIKGTRGERKNSFLLPHVSAKTLSLPSKPTKFRLFFDQFLRRRRLVPHRRSFSQRHGKSSGSFCPPFLLFKLFSVFFLCVNQDTLSYVKDTHDDCRFDIDRNEAIVYFR